MSRKKVILITGAAVVVVAAAIFAAASLLGNKKVVEVAEAPPVVAAENPQLRTIEVNSELIGTIEPDSIVYVTPKGAGEVTEVKVATGDMVQAGQLLCVIDTKQVESSKLSLETARISYEDAKSNLERMTVLHASGDVADADFQKLKDGVEMARLQYEGAKLGYDLQLESSRVTAPISGLVESCDVKIHDMVSPQSVISVIAGEGGKAVTFYTSERVVGGLTAGDPVRVEKNGAEHIGSITEVSTMIDPASGLFKVKASVPDGESLATGTSVKLKVVSQRADQVLSVPVDSVYYESGEPFVYTYGDGVLHKVKVTAGLSDSSFTEIKEGLNAGDQVVSTWTSELYDGSRVTLSEAGVLVPQAEEGAGSDAQSDSAKAAEAAQ